MDETGRSTPTTCPNCGRDVEEGFTFCDLCGTKLEPGPLSTAPGPAIADQGSERKGFLSRRREKWRDEKREREEAGERLASAAPLEEVDAPEVDAPEVEAPDAPETSADNPPAPAARMTSKPMKAEEFRAPGRRGGVAGRARWRAEDDEPAPASQPDSEAPAAAATVETTTETTWRPVAEEKKTSAGRVAVHILIAFLAGAVLLAVAAIVASLSSNGRVALLEVRGLPILIAGATSIVVYSLLRTGPKARGSRKSIASSVLVGFLVLVVAVALVFQPGLMSTAQKQIDRTLGLFGPAVEKGVEDFGGSVDQWNAEVDNYRIEHLKRLSDARNKEPDPVKRANAEETFRIEASKSESALDGIQKRMRADADAIPHALLREAMLDLAAVFADELAGIRKLTRGMVNDDQGLISSGNEQFKDATRRAVELFDERVEPLLERGGIQPGPLEASVMELLIAS